MSENFYGREFIVTSDVLIPRPETEMIIDAVLNLVGKPYLSGVRPGVAKLSESLTIIDVGTGSGCIAITLGLELPKAKIVATDVSHAALEVAKTNAERLGVGTSIVFKQADLLDSIETCADVVVANLPYVDRNWKWVNEEALADEPEVALYAEDGGLELIKRLVCQCAERKIKHLILEADPCQHEEIKRYAERYGLHLYETRGFVICFCSLRA